MSTSLHFSQEMNMSSEQWNGVLVGEKVEIEVEVEATKVQPAAAAA